MQSCSHQSTPNLPARISRKRTDLYHILDFEETGVFTGASTALDPIERRQEIRAIISEAEKRMLAMPQAEVPIKHYFSKGIYAREVFVPAGTLLTGKIHRKEHLNIISKGEISVLTEDGPRKIVAPFTLVSPPGTKRLGFAHTDTVWTTIHATEETDLQALEREFITVDYEPILVGAFLEEVQ